MKKNYNDDDYDPEDYLSIRDVAIREIFDRHCVMQQAMARVEMSGNSCVLLS